MIMIYINDKGVLLAFQKEGYIRSKIRLVDKIHGLYKRSYDW